MTVTRATTLLDQVDTALDGIADRVNIFPGRVDLPTYDPGDPATHPFWDLDDDGRVENVHAYAVTYPSPGLVTALLLDAVGDTLDWTLQVTCVGADRDRALWCAEQVRGALTGLELVTAGDTVLLGEDTDPGPVRRDDDVTPPRFYIPLFFTTTA